MSRFLYIIRSKATAWIFTWAAVGALFVFTIAGLHHYSDVNRIQATANTRTVLIESCQRSGNGTRKVILQLLDESKPSLKHALQTGQINQAEYNFQLKQLAADRAKVKLIDCESLYSKIK